MPKRKKISTQVYKILEEPNVYDDHLLDIIGNEFKFDHPKGISEWLKNSADAYIRADTPDREQFVYVILNDAEMNAGESGSIECLDFVGMTSLDIVKALKRWGDPEAAKRGVKKKVYGGHGNGGKFYMRQMFEKSYFITFRAGKLNVFGFSPNKKYGFAEGYRDKKMKPEAAVEFAGLSKLPLKSGLVKQVLRGDTGFTLVKGFKPRGMPKRIQTKRVIRGLLDHPQASRLLGQLPVAIMHNGKIFAETIRPEELQPLEGFEEPRVYEIPKVLSCVEGGEEKVVEMANKRFPPGCLILKTSEIALERGGRYGVLSRIDVRGELGIVASYPINEVASDSVYPQKTFIYGECECPILEDPEDDCVRNDRTKLVPENPKTKALLHWLGIRIDELAKEIADKERAEQEKMDRQMTSDYNQILDKWKNSFMSRIYRELIVGPGEGPGGGAGFGGSLGELGSGKGRGGQSGGGLGDEKGGGSKRKRGAGFPRVLLSGHDADPFDPEGRPLILDPRHPVIYQRLQDSKEGIYWINTVASLAEAILDRYGADSSQWRNYLFQRYVDIIIKQAVYDLEKRDPELFSAAVLDADIFGKLISKIHESASQDLDRFLFEERFSPS